MLTVCGAALTMIGAAGLGVCLCREQRLRAEELFLLEKAFLLAAGEISYGRTGLPELFVLVGKRLENALGRTLVMIGEHMEDGQGLLFEDIWREEMKRYLGTTRLKKEEIRYVLSFPETVGFLDGGRQQTALEGFGGELGRRARLARENLISQERTTMALCLSGGLMLTILLL